MNPDRLKPYMLAAIAMMAAACGSDTPSDGSDPKPDPNPPVLAQDASSDVLYEVNPRFYGDKGCLARVAADIPRIAGMGCDILWIMPPYQTGIVKSVGSPYCVKDYKSIDPILGTLDDFKTLVNTAHANGMKVILDWVANHTSFDNVWTVSHPERYRKDGAGNISATQQWGDVAQLDYSVRSTRDGMIDAMTYWVREAGVDGFRCDYAEGVPHDFWKEAIDVLEKENAGIIMLAESQQTDFWKDGFGLVYDWNFPSAVSSMFKNGNVSRFGEYVSDLNAGMVQGKNYMRYAFNHDVASENSVDTMYGGTDGTVAAYVLAAFSGGVPMIYSSMDVEGLKGKLSFFTNSHRDLKFSDNLTAVYAAINNAYSASATARGGKMKHYGSADAVVIGFENGNRQLLVMVNVSNIGKTVKTPIAFAGARFMDLMDDTVSDLPVSIDLPAYGFKILINN